MVAVDDAGEYLRAHFGEIDATGADGFGMAVAGKVREIMMSYSGMPYETVEEIAEDMASDLEELALWVRSEAK